jgi:RHS repeat-associated protein
MREPAPNPLKNSRCVCAPKSYNHLEMQLGPSSGAKISDGLMAAMVLLSEKPRQGVPSRNPALHPGIDERNSTVALGLRAGEQLNRVRSRYTGKERDAESGNDYFGARYYASSMGRFLSPDWSAQAEPVPYAKLDNPQSLNLYSYMYNSPLGGVDADGHWPGWLDNGVADTRQWAAEHPRTMEAAAAVATGVATVGAVALIVATAPVSVPATLGAAAITALTTTTAVIGATGGAVATVTLAAGAISGDVKGTSAAATAVGTVTNPVGMAVALGTGGNMQAAGTAATATSLVTGLQSAATGANALIQAGGAASAASAASGLAPAPTPAPARTPAPTPCSTDTSQCH